MGWHVAAPSVPRRAPNAAQLVEEQAAANTKKGVTITRNAFI